VKRFQFSLEQVLNLRAHDEREWELKLAAANAECQKVINRIRDTEGEFSRSLDLDCGADLYQLKVRSAWQERLKGEKAKLRDILARKEKERDKVRESWLEASKKRKVLDKLKEKREAEYKAHANKKAIKTLDDLITARSALKAEV
jgi:flagellar FliJ protein